MAIIDMSKIKKDAHADVIRAMLPDEGWGYVLKTEEGVVASPALMLFSEYHLAERAADHKGLRRFQPVSVCGVAVSGVLNLLEDNDLDTIELDVEVSNNMLVHPPETPHNI
jgi:hypothetical protein